MSKDIYERQASTYEEMMNICREETRERVAKVIRLCEPFADTPEGKVLMEEQIYSIIIQMLTYMQVGSKKLRKKKQREGIDNAMANGVHFGRRKKFVAEDHIEIFKKLEKGDISKDDARVEIGASFNTFSKMRKELKQKGLI